MGFSGFQAIFQADICLHHLLFQFSELRGDCVNELFKDKNSVTSGREGGVPSRELQPLQQEHRDDFFFFLNPSSVNFLHQEENIKREEATSP